MQERQFKYFFLIRSIEVTDILIAATAITNNLPVKTLNTRHFERVIGLDLV